MRQIRDDLWETRPDSPAPGLTTHAYLWTPPGGGNILFYNTAGDADLDEIERLGGVAHQYLSHQDEISPALNTFGDRFGATLHVSAAEADLVADVREPTVAFDSRHVDANGVEVIPTPGHTPGSTCYLATGSDGLRYLFTGDTIYLGADGWAAGYIPGFSDAADLAVSLELLATLEPEVVISSAFVGEEGAHVLGDRRWVDCVDEARVGLDRHLHDTG